MTDDNASKAAPDQPMHFDYQLTMDDVGTILDALAAEPETPEKIATGKKIYHRLRKHHQRLTFTPAFMLKLERFEES